MKTKILENLKNKYKDLGLSADTLEGVANQLTVFVKEESEIETAVAGAEGMLKSFQKFADSRVSAFKTEADKRKSELEALQTKLAELEKKGNGGKDPKPEPTESELVKTLMEKFGALETSLNQLSGQRKHEGLTNKFKELIGEEVPPSYYDLALSGKQFKDEIEVGEFAEVVKKGYEEHRQALANAGFVQTKPENNNNADDDDGGEIAKLINKGTEEQLKQKSEN